ncbi:MAG: GNAT family N-acetyltransferase [Deltaproteobacteria bacterium]|nr:GNAT family N-acetyltransferase [Deltaproteobacteria bacterium]
MTAPDEASDNNKRKKSKKRFKFAIREMELDDLAPVFHLGEHLFTAREVPNLYRTWDEYELIELYYADTEFCLVAEARKKIVGFALGTTIEKERSAWKYGYIVWMGVAPAYQGAGVGARMVAMVTERMAKQGARIVMVDTEADNVESIRFFRKMGFSKPEKHIYLSLNLSGQKHANHNNGGRKT